MVTCDIVFNSISCPSLIIGDFYVLVETRTQVYVDEAIGQMHIVHETNSKITLHLYFYIYLKLSHTVSGRI